jgi:hypothetical protein
LPSVAGSVRAIRATNVEVTVGVTRTDHVPFVADVAVPTTVDPIATVTLCPPTGHHVAFDVPTVPESVTEVPDGTRVELARSETVRP